MLVHLRNPTRQIEVGGPIRVQALLDQLGVSRQSVLVIRDRELVPGDGVLEDSDHVEIRPVISGGA